MSGATSRADFVYFLKSASPALPDGEAYFMYVMQSPIAALDMTVSRGLRILLLKCKVPTDPNCGVCIFLTSEYTSESIFVQSKAIA